MLDAKTVLQQLGFLAPEVVVTGVILLLILADILLGKQKRSLGFLVLAGLAFALSLTYALWKQYPNNILFAEAKSGMQALFGGSVVYDLYGLFFKGLFLLAGIIVVLMARPVLAKWPSGQGEGYTLMMSCTLGMMLMAGANDLLMMYLALEFVSITSYILAGMRHKDRKSAEASLKYIIYGAAASGMMIYGMSFLYGVTGTLQVDQIGIELSKAGMPKTMSLVVSVFVMAGFGYKIAAAPFHMWCPDVYEGAPTPITAFFSVGPKAAGFAMLVRFMAGVYQTGLTTQAPPDSQFQWNIVIAIVAILTMAVGNLGALMQQNLKRLMAYSSIGHAGYMLLAFTAFGHENVASVMFYLVVYMIMNLGAFLVVIVLEEQHGVQTVDNCRGLGWKAPGLCALMTLFMVSLTGLPPTAGFTGKLMLFGQLIEYSGRTGDQLPMILTIVGVLFSVISLYYYARIIGAMFLVKPREGEPTSAVRVPLMWNCVLWVLAAGTIFYGLFPGRLMEAARRAAANILPRI